MSFIKIWVHIVWGTKNREPLLNPKVRAALYKHIHENAQGKDIFLDSINGFTDHVHCLVKLQAGQNIAKIVQLLKGESAYWANKNQLTSSRLAWADEYFAVSVSESMVNTVRNYIKSRKSIIKKFLLLKNTMNLLASMHFQLRAKAQLSSIVNLYSEGQS